MTLTFDGGVEKKCWTCGTLNIRQLPSPRSPFCAAESRGRNKHCAGSGDCCGATNPISQTHQNAAQWAVSEQKAAGQVAGLGSFLPIFAKINHLHFAGFKAPLTKRCQFVSRVNRAGFGRSFRLGSEVKRIGGVGTKMAPASKDEKNKRGATSLATRYKSLGVPLRSSRSPIFTSFG